MTLKQTSLVGVLLAVACTSVRPVQPAEYIPQHNPEVVWVTYTDNSFVPVERPTVTGDTLKGTWAGLSEPVTIPFNQIQVVQAKMPNGKKTALLVGVVSLSVAGVAYTMATAGNSGSATFNGCNSTKGTANTTCCDGIKPGEKDNSYNC